MGIPAMSEPRPIYAPIPARALADTRLSGTDLRLLAAIAAHDRFGKNGTGCFASQRRLAALIGAHEKAVARSAGRLVEFGYMTSERSPTNGRLVIYRVTYTEDDGAAMRGDGRSFTKSAGLKLAPEPGTGSRTATDHGAASSGEAPPDKAATGSKSATEKVAIGNSAEKKSAPDQCVAHANIFPERDNRLREALLGNGEIAERLPEIPPPVREAGGGCRDELMEHASIDEQLSILRELHEGARPTAGLLENRLCRLARGAV